MSSYQYRKSHCGDKTVLRSSYLHNGISYTGKMTSSYWFSPQVIIWTKAGILLIWLLGTNFSEMLIEIDTLSLKKTHVKMSVKWQPFVNPCLDQYKLKWFLFSSWLDTLRPEWNDILKRVCLKENICALIPISLKFVLKGTTVSKSALVQVMAWQLKGNQPLAHYLNKSWPRCLKPYSIIKPQWVSAQSLNQNGKHFADGIFKCFFLNENFCTKQASKPLAVLMVTKFCDAI